MSRSCAEPRLLTAVAFFLMLVPSQAFSQATYSGRDRQLEVAIPRIEATAMIDGILDEGVWSQAAVLTGFSQYQPVDSRPAEEETTVYVWYAPDAIYFGVRAGEAHGDVVRATSANRDNIGAEDQVQILLDTYDDRRNSFAFMVNPLGVQADGTRADAFGGGAGGRSAMGGGMRSMNFLDGNIDLNPDYYFESKGRLVPGGYEVEIRIPFKSLRYQEGDIQNWGLHVLRKSQHSGYQDSWAPAVRASASFLGQAGELIGLTDMKRGLVLEVTPTATGRLDGSRDDDGSWGYDADGELGADVRWGLLQNLTLNGTINPDFSQVEADVGQVTLNERFALFYPEKRPFFLDGLELFDTPGQLIYTRRIAAPVVGTKIAGKVGALNIATILAADDRSYSDSGHDNPMYVVTRLRRDFGRNATVGGVLTAREENGDFSRLAGIDTRLYHDMMYYVEMQAVGSVTERAGAGTNGTSWTAAWDRTGRGWGFHYELEGISKDFEAAAGFVNRTNIMSGRASNRFTWYGSPSAFVQTASTFISLSRMWAYDDPGAGAIEGGDSVSPSATLRGGWSVGGNIARNFYAYKPSDYTSYTIDPPAGSGGLMVAPFVVPGIEDNQWTGSIRLTTPTWRLFTASASWGFGRTPIFREAAPGSSNQVTASIDLRPTQSLRATFQYTRLALDRVRDDSRYSTEDIPRLKIEYQLTRALFVRFIGQYTARDRSPLVDRNGAGILVNGVADTGSSDNTFQTDWLFSYRPMPGTLLYLGYGATLLEPESFRYRQMKRQADGFFAKASYLIRV